MPIEEELNEFRSMNEQQVINEFESLIERMEHEYSISGFQLIGILDYLKTRLYKQYGMIVGDEIFKCDNPDCDCNSGDE